MILANKRKIVAAKGEEQREGEREAGNDNDQRETTDKNCGQRSRPEGRTDGLTDRPTALRCQRVYTTDELGVKNCGLFVSVIELD